MSNSRFDATNDPAGNLPQIGNTGSPQPNGAPSGEPTGEPFLGIRFDCCRTYGRIYRNRVRTHYEGRCPKCFKRLKVPIGKDGVGTRFFRAS
ncbi:hypothetical protein N9N28_12120 [Rubripirellula amarantea]|uniref:Uncharacterized protein n=1 Tax=Rubripirellula amarantea TaxID=2527999 RepID=A0A5C5WEE9_9BACT|nr:hypothetical protein [Rubripirellula amarantea]MDA8745373.1 hypothetical protein [Rubripirellula amarantea]TWT49198.1 hypothetical protein Pla22_43900 [Rubripirellula amarantea]